MKKYLFTILLGQVISMQAQNKITFDYDTAGNQTNRELCINCQKVGYKTAAQKEITKPKEEELQNLSIMDGISYYPNPVKEELHLTWNLVANKLVKSIYLHDLNGRVLKTYSNLEHTSSYKISFFDYPQGTYLVVVQYNTNEQKTIKIVKK